MYQIGNDYIAEVKCYAPHGYMINSKPDASYELKLSTTDKDLIDRILDVLKGDDDAD